MITRTILLAIFSAAAARLGISKIRRAWLAVPIHLGAAATSSVAVLMLVALAMPAQATTITVMIGDDDGFGGTNGAVALPGSAYSNFSSPSIAPGTYNGVAGMDATTVAPFTPYKFVFIFGWDTSSLLSITSATVTIDSGSVARRDDGSGFGFASVSATDGLGGSLSLGDFWTTSTGAAHSTAEETVKAHIFNVGSLIGVGTTGTLTLTVDGSALSGAIDQFALDFARLDINGAATTVPEPASLTLLATGVAFAGLWRLRQREN